MSIFAQFQNLIDKQSAFSVNRTARIVARWTLSYSEVQRIVDSGELPAASIVFGPHMGPIELTTWQSFWLFCNRYIGTGVNVQIVVDRPQNKAAYELLLVEWNAE